MADSIDDLKRKSVLAHRILTMTGSMGDITGHVFVREPGTNNFFARCRNATDWSPAYVQPSALHRIDLDGKPSEDLGDYTPPPERFIGSTIMTARPDVNCVIHAHPPAQVLCGMTDVPLQPIVGSQNWSGSNEARKGIGIYGRSLLIHTKELGEAVLSIMGTTDVVELKGHGNIVTGRTIEEATLRAIAVENIAKLCWQLALQNKTPGEGFWEIPWEDVDDMTGGYGSQGTKDAQAKAGYPQRTGSWNGWDYYVKMLHDRPMIPEESTVDLVQF